MSKKKLLDPLCLNSNNTPLLCDHTYFGLRYGKEDVVYINDHGYAIERFRISSMVDCGDETHIDAPTKQCDPVSPKKEGTKHDQGKRDISLIPVDALLAVTEVFDFGKNKYGSHNWRSGFAWTRLSSAVLRHTLAWVKGEDLDQESKLPHLAHAAAGILMLLELTLKKVGTDDRFKEYASN